MIEIQYNTNIDFYVQIILYHTPKMLDQNGSNSSAAVDVFLRLQSGCGCLAITPEWKAAVL